MEEAQTFSADVFRLVKAYSQCLSAHTSPIHLSHSPGSVLRVFEAYKPKPTRLALCAAHDADVNNWPKPHKHLSQALLLLIGSKPLDINIGALAHIAVAIAVLLLLLLLLLLLTDRAEETGALAFGGSAGQCDALRAHKSVGEVGDGSLGLCVGGKAAEAVAQRGLCGAVANNDKRYYFAAFLLA